MSTFTLAQLSLAITMALTWVCIHLVARVWSPRRLFFMHLGRELTEADRARSRRVVTSNAVTCLVGMIMPLVTPSPAVFWLVVVVLPWVPIVHLLVEMVAVARSVQKAEGRAPGRYAVPLGETPTLTSYVSAPLAVAQVVVILLAVTVFLWVLPQLPDRVPMHWDMNGNVNRWGRPTEMWFFLGMLLFNLAIVWMVAWSVSKERWALPPERAEEYAALQRRRRATMVRFIEWMMFCINVSMAVMWVFMSLGQMPGRGWLIHTGIIGCVVVMAIGIVAPMIVFIPRMVRVQDEIRAIAGSDVLGTRPGGWVAGGMFYYAPDDPALWVPKRVGIGQTLNFGRRGAWIFLAAILLLPLVLALLPILLIE
jgi:uncharacterized membrane protein